MEGLGRYDGAPELLEQITEIADRAEDDLAALIARPRDGLTADAHRIEELESPGGASGATRVERILGAWGLPAEVVEQAAAEVAAAEGKVVVRLQFGAGDELADVAVTAASPAATPVASGRLSISRRTPEKRSCGSPQVPA